MIVALATPWHCERTSRGAILKCSLGYTRSLPPLICILGYILSVPLLCFPYLLSPLVRPSVGACRRLNRRPSPRSCRVISYLAFW